MKERREDVKAWVASLKDAPCLDCGRTFPSYVMDFDHVRGEKVGGINRLAYYGYSREVILAEIAKCDLICANCHRIRHYGSE